MDLGPGARSGRGLGCLGQRDGHASGGRRRGFARGIPFGLVSAGGRECDEGFDAVIVSDVGRRYSLERLQQRPAPGNQEMPCEFTW